ncbi:MAG: dihydrodipicolinate synthase family protein [Gemmatimonadota bacterium]
MKLEGIYLPVTTPFHSTDGGFDRDGFASNLSAWNEVSIAGILVGGSTGESVLLDSDELTASVRLARETLPDDRMVIAGTGRQSTRATIQACVDAASAGADAVLVLPPSYFQAQMTADALRLHFWEVADSSPVPVLLYQVPKFVPIDLVPDLVGELIRHHNIIGIKDSSGDIQSLGALCDVCGDKATVLVGAGTHLYAGLEIGARGGIIAVGLLAPSEATDLYEAFTAGRTHEAGRLQERIGPLHKAVVAGTGVPGMKYALDRLGFVGGPPRPPLIPPDEATCATIREALTHAGLRTNATAARD